MLIDKESQIKHLKDNKEALEGKVKFLQATCRRAGAQIKKLEAELKEATQWKEDEVEKFKARLRDGPSYEKRVRDYTEQ
jgi:chaperonin cofactor prefoldin|tara:strand:+ start:248 stop:484 length:237 start_codon:yes stop_codon:yes gene_type:complete